MDYNVVYGKKAAYTQAEIEGRNMWMVWTGGNDRLWDRLSVDSLGSFDLLKTISSHPGLGYGRRDRFYKLGLINEPCYSQATGPDPNRFGLWLDVRDPKCEPDPFASEKDYRGVAIGARGKTVAIGSYYGEPTGILGLRLFPNPDFDDDARKKWNSERFYNDPQYYAQRDLVRPYRVGMSCGFCHVGPNPIKPPVDPENPKWENLSALVGAQYFWWDRVFNWRGLTHQDSIFFQALHVSRPGSLDTSLVSTDNINNPRTMNAVYYLAPRMGLAKQFGKETLNGGERLNKQFNEFVPANDPLAQFFTPPSTTFTPRVLKDGSDSVGALGALNRVYINIGVFSEEWLLHFRALIGGEAISPILLDTAQKNSVYWRATELQTPYMARYLLAGSDPHYLKDAGDIGKTFLTEGAAVIERGKTVFAERCARCHSSKLPPLPSSIDLANANGPGYLKVWNAYWEWTKTESFKAPMRKRVMEADFLDQNYLSTELRVPVTLLGINACSPLATNALRDNIWDNFSSESYKSLPSVGTITIRHPLNGKEMPYVLPDGGRGYIRPASLVSLWSTAPYLQNNTVGPFEWQPSIESRMKSFQASIEQMLWPERRERDRLFPNPGPGVGIIDRITEDSFLEVPESYISEPLRPLVRLSRRLFPFIGGEGSSLRVGPFPKGMPIGLITNVDILGQEMTVEARKEHKEKVKNLVKRALRELKGTKDFGAALEGLSEDLFALSKCKDLVVNKGHYFGTDYFKEEPGLSDDDKRALIAFLKTF